MPNEKPNNDDVYECEKCGTHGSYNEECILCMINWNIAENAAAYRKMGKS